MDELPRFVLAEREALLQEIEEAFDGVSRNGGVSWREAHVIDAYGDKEERRQAKALEHDGRWQDLADDPEWTSETGPWAFLDAIGFRYYIPAALLHAVRTGDDWPSYLLDPSMESTPSQGLEQWKALDDRQRRCIRRYLEYMSVLTTCWPRLYEWIPARNALGAYWREHA